MRTELEALECSTRHLADLSLPSNDTEGNEKGALVVHYCCRRSSSSLRRQIELIMVQSLGVSDLRSTHLASFERQADVNFAV